MHAEAAERAVLGVVLGNVDDVVRAPREQLAGSVFWQRKRRGRSGGDLLCILETDQDVIKVHAGNKENGNFFFLLN